MCGISGLMRLHDRQPVSRETLARMNAAIAHRGPDGDGFHYGPGIGLGHRRLAIIDLAGGAQPMYNEDGTVAITFNGEIYNYTALRAELLQAGHRFQSNSDTEVIVHAWEQWGDACVRRLRGMFAFAIWDERRQVLFLARDRVGEKPLYYAEFADGAFAFASELKALLAHERAVRRIDAAAVDSFLAYGYVPDPRSIYEGMRKLPAGCTLTVARGRRVPAPSRYWAFDIRPSQQPVSERGLAAELPERLQEAVSIRLMSEVPLGAFLSGGVDSSSVVAMMARSPGAGVNTFSIGFDDPDFDESRIAEKTAAALGTRHATEIVRPFGPADIDHLAAIYDEPFGDSSAFPTLQVCAAARKHVTVALSGDGGDEVFAGYRRYLWHSREERMRRAVPAGLRAPLFGALGRLYPKLDWAPRVFRARQTFRELALSSLDGYFANVALVKDDVRRRILKPGVQAALDGYHAVDVIRPHFEAAAHADPLTQAQYVDLMTYLPGDILPKVDRASMAVSLEVRPPLLDHTLIEWAYQIGPEWKIRGGERKFILKRSMEPYVSRDVLYSPKRGFSMPFAAWFRGPLAPSIERAMASDVLADSGLFEPMALRSLAHEHIAGRRDHASALWSLWMFEAFLRVVHAGAGHAPAVSLARTA